MEECWGGWVWESAVFVYQPCDHRAGRSSGQLVSHVGERKKGYSSYGTSSFYTKCFRIGYGNCSPHNYKDPCIYPCGTFFLCYENGSLEKVFKKVVSFDITLTSLIKKVNISSFRALTILYATLLFEIGRASCRERV